MLLLHSQKLIINLKNKKKTIKNSAYWFWASVTIILILKIIAWSNFKKHLLLILCSGYNYIFFFYNGILNALPAFFDIVFYATIIVDDHQWVVHIVLHCLGLLPLPINFNLTETKNWKHSNLLSEKVSTRPANSESITLLKTNPNWKPKRKDNTVWNQQIFVV